VPLDHDDWMRRAISEAERARGSTGDNPWVGCAIVDARGVLVSVGHTRGPGEDHAEIDALREAKRLGISVLGTTMYSTLEPCAFHGRTPACARVIVEHEIGTLVYAMRDPNPRVDGAGARILIDGGVEVIEGVREDEVRRQLGSWVLDHHPHEPMRRAHALHRGEFADTARAVADAYAVDIDRAIEIVRLALDL
jgi:diaminohydroxyphosphoribosylaminopyrimidine deaminase / 5-amino-6-(5-phosphoribosylamino)uracil reductase